MDQYILPYTYNFPSATYASPSSKMIGLISISRISGCSKKSRERFSRSTISPSISASCCPRYPVMSGYERSELRISAISSRVHSPIWSRVSSRIVRNIPPAPTMNVSPKFASRFAPKKSSSFGDGVRNFPIATHSISPFLQYFSPFFWSVS